MLDRTFRSGLTIAGLSKPAVPDWIELKVTRASAGEIDLALGEALAEPALAIILISYG